MSWYMQWSDSIKKRACRYLLQRYVGQFLEEKLTLDKLSVNIYSGTGSVSNVSLDAQALNELGAQKNLPIEFVDGFITEIAVSIPWATLFTDSIYLEVTGMHITIQPKQRPDDAGSMLESMWSSMASSIQLAAECLKQDSNSIDGKEPENENSMEGLEIFANAIESILTRVKIKLIDTRIRLEHLPREGKNGIAVEIKLKVVEYCDETSCEWGVVGDSTDTQKSPSSFSIKKFHCDGITFYTDEFPVENRTFSRSIIEDEKLSKSTEKIKETSEPILIGMLSGSNVVRVKLKLDPNVNEPKVDLEFILGSFTLFLSPRQLYLVIEILQSLASPHNQDTSNVVSKKTAAQKIMSSNDFKKVEQDLQETLNFPAYNSYQMPKTNHGKGWSSASFDEGDEEFHPMKLTNLMSGSVTSTATDTSFCSHASSKPEGTQIGYDFPSFNGPFRKKFDRGSIYDSEVMEETSAFHFQLTSVAAVILHEDILTFGLDTCELTPSSVSTMKNLSNKFFAQLGKFVLAGNKDFEAFKQALSKTCSLNHIRLLGTTIIVEGNDSGNSSSSCFSSVISAASVELLECLVESSSTSDGQPQYVELLKFMKSSNPDESISPAFHISNHPDVRVHLQHSKRNHNSKRSSRFEISINLEQCWTEVDLSIFDRISSVLNSQPLCHVKNTPKDFMDEQASFTQALESTSLVDKSFFLKVQSPFFVVKFRFPIPDLRPAHEKGKFPWWQRSIRKDILYLNLLETSFHTDQSSKSPVQEYILSCKEVTFLFKEGNTDLAIPFIHSSSLFPSSQMSASSEPCPRLIVKLLPTEVVVEEEIIREKEENSGLSYSTYMDNPRKDPSPFMSKKVVHENDPHHPAGDGEELVIPALDKDINDFINSALEDAKIQVDISLPYLSVEFPSKHLYEILYNRINSDLSLWQFTGPKHQKDTSGINPTLFHPSFSMCKSGLHVDSDSDGSEDSDDLNFKSAQKNDFSKYGVQSSQSNMALNINITKGVLDLSEILKDSAGNIIPDKQAEIYVDVSGGSVFAVTHYEGKPQQNYVCLKMKGVQVYHKTDMNINVKRKPSELRNFKSPPLHLDPILLKSNRDIIVTSLNPEGQNSNMFVAAISTQVNERRMKTIRIACSLSSATLCHRVTPSHNSWLTQFMDFFDVVDYPVKGYDSPQVITELYLHLWDCAIDYRPLYLPYCSVITLGNLSISSNIAARTKTSTLRFIAEEASLFISHKGKHCSTPANLKSDYISVMHLGFFELSLRISDQVNNAKIDLKASNNVLNIRTCSDSASALANLIIYYASEGDLKKAEKKEEKKLPLPKAESVEKDPSVLLPEKAVERVNDMMEDAMKDLSGHANQSQDNNEDPADVFYFPGEGAGEISEPIDWGDCGDLDEDFCVIDNETPIGCSIPKNGKPEVRILSDKKIVIKENHFNIGIGKSDQLVSPKYYPMPVYRYTLSDMNIIWCMYGGKDFSEKPPAKKNVAFNREDPSRHNSDAVPEIRDFEAFPGVYYNTGSGTVDPLLSPSHASRKQTKSAHSWQLAGGEGRQHNVLMEFRFNKVKFQHEIYPDKTQQASRQVLLIHEFEIRDKLSSSQINKFLYQYSSESNPRQSHANMILIKALHLRPDSRRNIQETCLKVSLLPLRLNIDQDSLQFLVTFFTELSGLTIISEDETGISNSTQSFPVMGIDGELISPPSPMESSETQSVNGDGEIASNPGASPTFIRSFVFSPEVPIRIDYVGKHVDLTHGPFAGLLMGLAQLSCLQIRLKRLNYKHGLLGFEKLFNFAISEWVKDIKKSQVPGIIGGVGPMHALVQLFQGIRDLFWLPIEQYQKDGRIVRGLQRGANSFTTSTAIAALELTARIVQAIQSIAEAAFDMVSPGPSVRRINGTNKHKKQHLFSHPADIREGVANAITLVKEGIGETAETLVRVASSEAEQKGAVGAVGGVLRQIPPTVVTPIILASAATSNLLGGVRSQLAPDTQREATNKWKQNITHK